MDVSPLDASVELPGTNVPAKRRGETFLQFWERMTFDQRVRWMYVAELLGHVPPYIGTWYYYDLFEDSRRDP